MSEKPDVDVWVLMPTALADHAWATFDRWHERGYKLALYTDRWTTRLEGASDLLLVAKYPGVWNAANMLAKAAYALGGEVFVFAGDDMDPDPSHTARDVAVEYLARFPDGYGVMQPCGDPQGKEGFDRPAAARICGSGWFGRGWVERAYGGKGPTCDGYWHFYADEDLARYAERLGVMWWRPDLTQYHRHWSWGHLPRRDYHEKNQSAWGLDKSIFEARRRSGFP